jgi:hypothetical protein
MKPETKQRFYGEEFMDAERKLFAKLPKKYHVDVRDVLSKLQLWDMLVFLNVHGEIAQGWLVSTASGSRLLRYDELAAARKQED